MKSSIRRRNSIDFTKPTYYGLGLFTGIVIGAMLASLLACQPAPSRPDLASPVEIRTVPCPHDDGDCWVLEPRLPREAR